MNGDGIAPDMWPADTEALRTRIARLEAQSETRRLQTLYWQERAQGQTEDLICANLEIETLTARIQAVRDMHAAGGVVGVLCQECSTVAPCLTVHALDVSPD